MPKSRLYLLQILGIILLMVGYVLSDAPDSNSVMHFDLTASHTISAVKHNGNNAIAAVQTAPDGRTSGKMQESKHLSFKVALIRQPIMQFRYIPLLNTCFTLPVPENYFYLFSKEINPPPPKAC